jgi:ubiquinone/menaquinone biosynthesis C-methylase UbiE
MSSRAKEVFLEIHSGIPKEGPGDSQSTGRAFSQLVGLPPRPRILDIGCGPGRQTLDLASLTDGQITAVDAHEAYLIALDTKAKQKGLSDRVHSLRADMNALAFADSTFDVIWAEGSIYIIGFENGLRRWKPLLRSGGWFAATELSWVKPYPPDEAKQFWAKAYPAMKSLADNLKVIERCGYVSIDHFALPESAWWEGFYEPIEQKLVSMRQKYTDDAEALLMIRATQAEIDIYRKYSDYYAYVFYVMRAAPGEIIAKSSGSSSSDRDL